MKNIYFTLVFLTSFIVGNAQTQVRPITTAVNFLQVTPDARGGALGDQGVATSADSYSQFWNPSKYIFHSSKSGATLSYTPYLTALVNDVNLSQLTYFNQISERGAFSIGFRYFGLGEIEFREKVDDPAVIRKPNELALDAAYSLKLSDHFAMGVAGRFIRSNLKIPNIDPDASSANTFAVDVSGFYDSEEFAVSDLIGKYRLGFNIQNLGPKLSYTEDGVPNFLPSNLKIGAGFDIILDQYNTIGINVEFNKLLVPTPQERSDLDGDGDIDLEDARLNQEEYNRQSWSSGIFSSFGDAPDGGSEELAEVTWALGLEYWYQEAFAVRAGYYRESEIKGLRRYYTIGAGFKYNVVGVDLSYIFSTSNIPNPLEGTLRFSLSFNFEDAVRRSSSNNKEE